VGQSPTSDPSWKGLPSWLVFTFLVIAPPAAFVAFVRSMNPVVIALLILTYELLLFIGRFAGKIWQPLEESLAKYIAHWVTVRTQEITSHYYHQYYEYIIAEHQVFDVKGLSTRTAHDLALEQVFVDLHVHPLPPHQANNNPIHLPEALQGTHSIWDYLSNPELANPHLVILGAPGSGKTTLLKHLALTLAQPKKLSQHLRSHSFPILLFLRDHATTILAQPSTFSLANAIEEHIQQKWQRTIPTSWLQRFLEQGKCLVLLDGLDELADSSTRKKVIDWVQQQLLTYGRNRFVLTSRPYGYRENPLNGVTILDVQAFTQDQVERFIHNWYLANELKSWGKDDLSVQLHTREGTQDLLKRLHQAPALLSLAVNPLLLTMIATVHRYRSSLPGKRVDLYAEICEVFLGKRHEAFGITHELSPAQKQQVLQPLAYWMMQQGKREITLQKVLQVIQPSLEQVAMKISPTEFLRLIENESGLFLENNPGMYGFAHLTFQEYLAAVHIKEEETEHVLIDQVSNSWWHETMRLYCAQADATVVIQACLAGSPPTIEALVLAFECDEEKLKIQPHVQTQLNTILKTNVDDVEPERRQVIAEVLLARRLHRMILLHHETYIDTSFITCAEYQVFLDEQRAQSRYYQPDHWTTFSYPKGSANTPILGVRRSDAQAFCVWLTTRDKEGWQYHLPRSGEWPLKKKEQWKEPFVEAGYWVDDEPLLEWVQGNLSEALQQHIAFALTRASNRPIDLALARALDLTSARNRTLALDRDLVHSRHLISDLVRDLASVDTRDLASVDTRARARILTNARLLANALGLTSAYAFDLYIVLFLLQERIAGRFPAYEGILLVKEHQQRNNNHQL
jgi:NACHT domain/Sulfatase-modifying factor enzyme 1